MLKQSFLAALVMTSSITAYAAEPHFYLQMGNHSGKPVTITVKPNVGNMHLEPALVDHTPLADRAFSTKYGVVFEPLTAEGKFDVVFTGKKDCTFTVGYFAPGNPKITVMGHGCDGGGYSIIDNGHTLLLYVTGIHLGKTN